MVINILYLVCRKGDDKLPLSYISKNDIGEYIITVDDKWNAKLTIFGNIVSGILMPYNKYYWTRELPIVATIVGSLPPNFHSKLYRDGIIRGRELALRLGAKEFCLLCLKSRISSSIYIIGCSLDGYELKEILDKSIEYNTECKIIDPNEYDYKQGECLQ